MKKSKFNLSYVLLLMLGAFVGFFGAALIDNFSQNVPAYIVIPYLMLVAVISFWLVFVLHELGHLVMGLLTGYEFVSFRIGSLTFIKENGKIVRKKFNIVGTGGQCILTYKEVENAEDIPYFWYHFGGVFFNFLTSAICLILVYFAQNSFVILALFMLCMVSLGIGILNGIPTNSAGIGNDGYNLKILKENKYNRIAIYKTMVINALQFQGVKLQDITGEIINFTDEEKSCMLGNGLEIIEANLCMNKKEFKMAEEKYNKVASDENALVIYQNECKCELAFCKIMNGAKKEEIDNILDKELMKYINLTLKTYISRRRLMYAYYLFVEKDTKKAEQEYLNAVKMEKTYPARGEYLAEMELIEYVKKKYDGAI